VAVYVLIMVGGIVRSTGSGMGCPDWPKCFGGWMPPTSVDQLPSDYKEINSTFRDKKNQKFMKYLNAFGFHETADRLASDPSVGNENDFNVTRAWIEYVNRLVGVVIGFLIVGVFVRSIPLRKQHPRIFWFALASLIGVIFQGWFGSIVVSTNLTTWTITVHMFLALLIVVFLIYIYYLSEAQGGFAAPASLKWILVGCMATLLVQIYLGTQVREAIDVLNNNGSARNTWIDQLSIPFFIHRSLSILVGVLHVFLFIQMAKWKVNSSLSIALLIIILIAIATGIGMAYFDVPAALQPTHLVLATVAFGIQLLLLFRMKSLSEVTVR
jgi:cytochrome c oxidase assembly protein subunit 15